MYKYFALAVISFLLSQSGLLLAQEKQNFIGVTDPQRAEYNWVMHCRGCHGVGAKGSGGGAPAMSGVVARFLKTEQGRAFLGRVPGVAFVELPDKELAELLNWLLQTFDNTNLPDDFIPYDASEVTRLRQSPLISEVFTTRFDILKEIDTLYPLYPASVP